MKRLIAFTLLICLLLCGCQVTKPAETEPSQPLGTTEVTAEATTEATSEATTEATAEATTEATAEPTQPKTEKVKVYLLEKVALFDAGYKKVSYDKKHNLEACEAFTLDGNPWCDVFFAEKNDNGMACKLQEKWGEEDSRTLLVTYTEDGKVQEGLYEGSDYSGFQCQYDENGNLVRVADYIDGVLQSVVYYIYEDGKLSRGWCEDKEGNPAYELVVKKGRIAEKQYYTTDGEYSHSLLYEYDKHGNLTQEQFSVDGEVSPSETYTYKAVEVDADRAEQLLKQQEQFIWLLSNYVGL